MTKPKATREKKEAFKIDFLSLAQKDLKDIAKELFAPVTKGTSITLPGTLSVSALRKGGRGKKAKEKEKKNNHLLPDDMHFTSRQLVTLFLKPKFSVCSSIFIPYFALTGMDPVRCDIQLKMRGQRVRFNENGDEVDENFWAQAAADQAAGRNGDEEGDESEYYPYSFPLALLTFIIAANGGAIPFNTQFFHDDYDDGPGFDDVFEGEGDGVGAMADVDAGEQDLLAATAGQTRRVRPEFVNYAKKAKRVDVRKLKENIWKGLDIKIVEVKEPQSENEDEPMVYIHPLLLQLIVAELACIGGR
jgi:condensin complex subunit 2